MVSISNKARIYFYDHSPGKYDQKSQTGRVALLDVTRLISKTDIGNLIVRSKEDATHLVVHLDDLSRNKALLGEWPESARVDQIVLCLTTENKFNPIKFPHRLNKLNGFDRATFFCRDTEQLGHADAFATFCNLSISDAKRIAVGEISSSNSILRQIFYEVSEHYLAALTILCQAYLVVWASATPDLARSSTKINETLEEMGWWTVVKDSGGIPHLGDPKELSQAMTAQWWVTTLTNSQSRESGEKTRRVLARIRNEWATLLSITPKVGHPHKDNWADVERLMKAIGLGIVEDGKPSSVPQAPLEPAIVAQAYCAIKEIMGSKELKLSCE
jgi:hypothetical protein